ncbi:hypothetical protein U9M48_017911 [Paspalum notatum var. saurae]|uniref:Alliinase C-terminal domain-containing protein n=1 Tax=Paspalum notatum var. saurae TaxID=547442 RepID=A0AAQ3T9J2_PASNO
MEEAAGQQPRRRPAAGLWALALFASLFLNVVLLLAHHHSSFAPSRLRDGGSCGLSWALQAATAAEAVAAVDCSGHGQVFLDGVAAGENGRPGCECNRCFGGPDCSLRTPNCTADATSGNPLFLEPYWKRHAAASAVLVSGWHRLSYSTTDGIYQSVELENHIRRLHRAVGNAVVDGMHLVFGGGSTQLINALVYALSPDAVVDDNASSPPAPVVATAPYYPPYRTQTQMFDGREYRWNGTTAALANASSSGDSSDGFIEFVTSPNNPDGMLHKAVLRGSAVVADHAYYWPHFTHISAPADEDVMLFTMSKPSGHAGSRFGWALIRDETVAKRAYEYVQGSIMGASRDTQLRMLGIVKVMLANLHAGKEDIFAFGYDVMRSRWRRLSAAVSRSRRISLQKIPPQYCTYFNRVREPSPAYAWVRCEREEDDDCYKVLLKAKIISRSGTGYEASSRYTRVSLLKSDDDFEVLMERVTDLVDAENYEDTTSSSSMSW